MQAADASHLFALLWPDGDKPSGHFLRLRIPETVLVVDGRLTAVLTNAAAQEHGLWTGRRGVSTSCIHGIIPRFAAAHPAFPNALAAFTGMLDDWEQRWTGAAAVDVEWTTENPIAAATERARCYVEHWPHLRRVGSAMDFSRFLEKLRRVVSLGENARDPAINLTVQEYIPAVAGDCYYRASISFVRGMPSPRDPGTDPHAARASTAEFSFSWLKRSYRLWLRQRHLGAAKPAAALEAEDPFRDAPAAASQHDGRSSGRDQCCSPGGPEGCRVILCGSSAVSQDSPDDDWIRSDGESFGPGPLRDLSPPGPSASDAVDPVSSFFASDMKQALFEIALMTSSRFGTRVCRIEADFVRSEDGRLVLLAVPVLECQPPVSLSLPQQLVDICFSRSTVLRAVSPRAMTLQRRRSVSAERRQRNPGSAFQRRIGKPEESRANERDEDSVGAVMSRLYQRLFNQYSLLQRAASSSRLPPGSARKQQKEAFLRQCLGDIEAVAHQMELASVTRLVCANGPVSAYFGQNFEVRMEEYRSIAAVLESRGREMVEWQHRLEQWSAELAEREAMLRQDARQASGSSARSHITAAVPSAGATADAPHFPRDINREVFQQHRARDVVDETAEGAVLQDDPADEDVDTDADEEDETGNSDGNDGSVDESWLPYLKSTGASRIKHVAEAGVGTHIRGMHAATGMQQLSPSGASLRVEYARIRRRGGRPATSRRFSTLSASRQHVLASPSQRPLTATHSPPTASPSADGQLPQTGTGSHSLPPAARYLAEVPSTVATVFAAASPTSKKFGLYKDLELGKDALEKLERELITKGLLLRNSRRL